MTHFIGTEPMEVSHLVHLRFHDQFQDPVDLSMILPSLRIGNTLAVLTPDKGTVVSALRFVEYCKEPCHHSFSCDRPVIPVRWNGILAAGFGVSWSTHSF